MDVEEGRKQPEIKWFHLWYDSQTFSRHIGWKHFPQLKWSDRWASFPCFQNHQKKKQIYKQNLKEDRDRQTFNEEADDIEKKMAKL